MAQNDFIAWAVDPNANVASQSDYASNSPYVLGFKSGIALSKYYNKALRQPSFMSAMIAAFIVQNGQNAADDGSISNLLNSYNLSMTAFVNAIVVPEVAAEANRAAGVENNLATQITNETGRATGIENQLSQQSAVFQNTLSANTYNLTNSMDLFNPVVQTIRRVAGSNVTYVTANINLQPDQMGTVIVDATNGGITLNLPDANQMASLGYGQTGLFSILRIDQSNNPVQISGVNNQKISSAGQSLTSLYNGERMECAPVNSAWFLSRLSNSFYSVIQGVGSSIPVVLPPGLRAFRCLLVGGGGGGGCTNGTYNGAGGGAGYAAWFNFACPDGTTEYVSIGAGGAGGATNGSNGGNGSASAFLGLIAGGGYGGYGGSAGTSNSGGAGGVGSYTPPNGLAAITGVFGVAGNSGMDGGMGNIGTGIGGAGPMGGTGRPQNGSSTPGNSYIGGGGCGSYGSGGVGANGGNGALFIWGL